MKRRPKTLSALIPDSPSESICERARRIAREEQAAARREREAKRAAFLDTICVPHERTLNDDGTYTICGWRWAIRGGYDTKDLVSLVLNEHIPLCAAGPQWYVNRYRGFDLDRHYVYNVKGLGQALLAIDRQCQLIDTQFPKTLWGRIKLFLHRYSPFL